ncbi:MAG: ABC transporter ATP-binding protein [bacterium]
MSEPVIRIEALTKRYRELVALDRVSLEVEHGEIFALLGPNGAGKTTLISIVSGLTRATSGTARVFGHDVVREFRTTRRLLGLVPQEVNFDPFFSPLQALRFQRGFFGLSDAPELYREILENLDLWEKRDAYTRTLSGGMKRRLLIAKALVHQPRVLFLDEPTAGVDVALRQDLWKYVRRLRAEGVTIVLTTHYLEEAEELADRVGILDKGQLKLVDTKLALMASHGGERVNIRVAGDPSRLPAGLRSELREGELAVRGVENVADAIESLVRAGLRVENVERQPVRLEDVFLEVIGRAGRQAPP